MVPSILLSGSDNPFLVQETLPINDNLVSSDPK